MVVLVLVWVMDLVGKVLEGMVLEGMVLGGMVVVVMVMKEAMVGMRGKWVMDRELMLLEVLDKDHSVMEDMEIQSMEVVVREVGVGDMVVVRGLAKDF